MKRLLFFFLLGCLAAEASAATLVQGRTRFDYSTLGGGLEWEAADEGGWIAADDNPSFTVTIGNLTNGNATIGFHWFATTARTITSVTFDGVSATEVDDFRVDLGAGSETGFAVYGISLGSKGAGTYTVQINFSGTVDEGAMGVNVHSGAHQTLGSAYGTPESGTAAGAATETATIASATGEVVICLFGQTDTSVTVGAGQTQRWLQNNAATYADAQSSTEPGAASVDMTWASSPSATLGYGYIVVSLKPAS